MRDEVKRKRTWRLVAITEGCILLFIIFFMPLKISILKNVGAVTIIISTLVGLGIGYKIWCLKKKMDIHSILEFIKKKEKTNLDTSKFEEAQITINKKAVYLLNEGITFIIRFEDDDYFIDERYYKTLNDVIRIYEMDFKKNQKDFEKEEEEAKLDVKSEEEKLTGE